MDYPVDLVFPKGDSFVMEFVQTDQGRVQQPKTLSAHSEGELMILKHIGWVEKYPPVVADPVPAEEEVDSVVEDEPIEEPH